MLEMDTAIMTAAMRRGASSWPSMNMSVPATSPSGTMSEVATENSTENGMMDSSMRMDSRFKSAKLRSSRAKRRPVRL